MKEFTEQDMEKFKDMDDFNNPAYMFSLTSTRLLSEALKGGFDVTYLIKRELASRGMNKEGLWVGFKQAKKLHGIG